MAISEHPMQKLAEYLPDNTFHPVLSFLNQYKVHLKITRQRATVLGDYRHKGMYGNHIITVNGNLNKYEFLLTLLHELAHLLTYEQHKNKVAAHGIEWKINYGKILQAFVELKCFPEDIEKALNKTIRNPAATTAGESELIKILRRYNANTRPDVIHVEQLQEGQLFVTKDGRVFKRGNLRRKRYECIDVNTGLKYHISAIAEVKLYEATS
jgi:SprT protein